MSVNGENPVVRQDSVIAERLTTMPEGSYTAYLALGGLNRTVKKIGEEAMEVALAFASETDERVVSELADLVYVLDVALQVSRGVGLVAVFQELERRRQEDANKKPTAVQPPVRQEYFAQLESRFGPNWQDEIFF